MKKLLLLLAVGCAAPEETPCERLQTLRRTAWELRHQAPKLAAKMAYQVELEIEQNGCD